MPHWVFVAIIVALIIALDQIADRRKATADDRRTKRLVERAKREYPHNSLTESLGDLHKALYNEIVLANIENKPIERLRHDRDLVVARVCRLWQEEMDLNQAVIEAGSSYRVDPAGNLTARDTRIRPFRTSSPRTSSLPNSD